MRIRLLIATQDAGYSDHLSEWLTEKYADIVDVCVCGAKERLPELLAVRRFDVALLESPLDESTDRDAIRLPLMLWSEDGEAHAQESKIRSFGKYRRISAMVSEILELYSRVLASENGAGEKRARVTAVWSPAGGVGKTAVALAYAARKASEDKQVLYLNLEPFSSVPVFFQDTGKSISAVFEMLEAQEGNVRMLIQSIRRRENNVGISYLWGPENFDDMNILSENDVATLITVCAGETDELVIDLSSVCDERTRRVFELADSVLLVTDNSTTAQAKYAQFASQHNVFERIRGKAALVANRGAALGEALTDTVIALPRVQSADATVVYMTLARSLVSV